MSAALDFATTVHGRQIVIGYWTVLDSPIGLERLAQIGYDYIALDAQHGTIDYTRMLSGLTAIDGSRGTVGVVRVGSNDPAMIGKALDAGAAGIIVPMISSAADAAAAVSATRYPPDGIRSWGPLRSQLRIGPDPASANDSVIVLAMIETDRGLAEVNEIAATPGLDGLYVGPVHLAMGLGATSPNAPTMTNALTRVKDACESAGITPGIYTTSGTIAARRLQEGFTFVSVGLDLTHLEQAAVDHLAATRKTT